MDQFRLKGILPLASKKPEFYMKKYSQKHSDLNAKYAYGYSRH